MSESVPLLREKAPTINTVLSLSGPNLVVDECTSAVGLEPTSSRATSVQRGVRLPSGEPNILPPEWILRISSDSSWEIDPELNRLLDLIWPRRALIKALLTADPSLSGTFLSNVHIEDGRPVYELLPATLSRLAELGLAWCMDIFDYRSSE
jgi:hypothetical protein